MYNIPDPYLARQNDRVYYEDIYDRHYYGKMTKDQYVARMLGLQAWRADVQLKKDFGETPLTYNQFLKEECLY